MENEFAYTYILANHHRTVVYVGSTANLKKRIYLHRNRLIPGFTKKCNVTKLVYFESLSDRAAATARERLIKGGSRAKKFALIGVMNSLWHELYGIEPLIGHVKEFGLRKSKMRSDQAILSSGYRCVTGFNLHQMLKYLDGKAA